MKLIYVICALPILTNADPKVTWDKNPISNAVDCNNITCPAVENPICVKLKFKSANETRKPTYVLMINKCEMKYMTCYKHVDGAIVNRKYCDHNHIRKRDGRKSTGKKRSKRNAVFGKLESNHGNSSKTPKSSGVNNTGNLRQGKNKHEGLRARTLRPSKIQYLRRQKSDGKYEDDDDDSHQNAKNNGNVFMKPMFDENIFADAKNMFKPKGYESKDETANDGGYMDKLKNEQEKRQKMYGDSFDEHLNNYGNRGPSFYYDRLKGRSEDMRPDIKQEFEALDMINNPIGYKKFDKYRKDKKNRKERIPLEKGREKRKLSQVASDNTMYEVVNDRKGAPAGHMTPVIKGNMFEKNVFGEEMFGDMGKFIEGSSFENTRIKIGKKKKRKNKKIPKKIVQTSGEKDDKDFSAPQFESPDGNDNSTGVEHRQQLIANKPRYHGIDALTEQSESDDDPEGIVLEGSPPNANEELVPERPQQEQEQEEEDEEEEKEENDEPEKNEEEEENNDAQKPADEDEEDDYEADCPKRCPSRAVMVCARCNHDVYRTFLSICHMRMFACRHTDEKMELISRYPCVASAPYLNSGTEMNMDPEGRVDNPDDHDKVLRFINCRSKGLIDGENVDKDGGVDEFRKRCLFNSKGEMRYNDYYYGY